MMLEGRREMNLRLIIQPRPKQIRNAMRKMLQLTEKGRVLKRCRKLGNRMLIEIVIGRRAKMTHEDAAAQRSRDTSQKQSRRLRQKRGIDKMADPSLANATGDAHAESSS